MAVDQLQASPLLAAMAQLFNDAQDSRRESTTRRLLARVWKLEAKSSQEEYIEIIQKFVDALLVEAKRTPSTEHLCAFIVRALVGQSTAATDQQDMVLRPPAMAVLERLAHLTKAKDRTVRFRACHLIFLFMKTCTELENVTVEWDEDILSHLTELMISRASDRLPLVRAYALQALRYLQLPEAWAQEDNPITSVFIQAAKGDTSAEVRRIALMNMDVTEATLPAFLQRVRDTSEKVRMASYTAMGSYLTFQKLASFSALHVLEDGLKDRDPKVRRACAEMCKTFFPETDTTAESLLAFNVVDNEAIAEQVVRAIFEMEGEEAAFEIDMSVLTCESAFVWRVLCEHHQALATPRSQTQLDSILPTLTDLCSEIVKYKELYQAAEEDMAKGEVFIVSQLLKIAAKGDMTDEIGKGNLSQLIRSLLTEESSGFLPAAMDCLVALWPRPADQASIVTELVGDMLGQDGSLEVPNDGTLLRCLQLVNELFCKAPRESFSLRDGAMNGLITSLVFPGLQHQHPKIRGEVLRCLGHCCLQDIGFAKQFLLLLLEALGNDIPPIKKIVMEILFDVVLIYGIEKLGISVEPNVPDEESEESCEPECQEEQVTHTYLPVLRRYLDSDNSELRTVAAEGFARLLLNDCLESSSILASLMVLYFNPITEEDTMLRQCLSVFFESYVYVSYEHQLCVEEAVVPILDTILNAPTSSPLSQINVKQVGLYLTYLTSISSVNPAVLKPHHVPIHDTLAIRIANKLLGCPIPNEQRLWCRVLGSTQVDSVETVRQLRILISTAMKEIEDRPARRLLESYLNSLPIPTSPQPSTISQSTSGDSEESESEREATPVLRRKTRGRPNRELSSS